MGRNIILTGPPRSGTTLTCHLINKLPNIVALHEPMNLKMFPDRKSSIQNIKSFFSEMRQMITEENKAISRIKDGKIPTNPFESGENNRKSIVAKGEFEIDKPLNNEFDLVIKQNGHFSFLLEDLKEEYECFSVIRNPLTVLASWNSIQAPVSRGNLNVLKGLDPILWDRLEGINNIYDRQITLLNELFNTLQYISNKNLIRYEDLISTGGKNLFVLHPEASKLNEHMENQNSKNKYDKETLFQLAGKLISKGGAWTSYYDEADLNLIINN